MSEQVIAGFAQYGALGLMVVLQALALAYITKRFISHLESQAASNTATQRAATEANVAVANNLHRMGEQLARMEQSMAQHDRDATTRHERLMDRLGGRQ